MLWRARFLYVEVDGGGAEGGEGGGEEGSEVGVLCQGLLGGARCDDGFDCVEDGAEVRGVESEGSGGVEEVEDGGEVGGFL